MTKSISASCSSIASSPPRARLAFALTTSLVALLLASPARGDDVRPDDACTSARSRYVVAPGAATLHGLARCHEDQGKTASAWAEYLEAATIAHREKRAEIEIASKQRAKGLEPKLTKLVITVAAGADTEGLEVRRDGIAMDRAVWGSAVPVDPGPHVVVASAPRGRGAAAWWRSRARRRRSWRCLRSPQPRTRRRPRPWGRRPSPRASST